MALHDPDLAGFADPPAVLPAHLTVDSVGEVESSAACLARFLVHLHGEYGLREIDLIGHSLGGVFSRSAHMQLRAAGAPIAIVSLTSIGTPWLGSFVRHFTREAMPMPEPAASFAASIMDDMRKGGGLVADGDAPVAWGSGKEHGLDGLALTRIAGTYVRGTEEPYPHDCMVSRRSALALDEDPQVFPPAACHEVDAVHSIAFARVMDLPWERSITWDPQVMDVVVNAINQT